MIEINIVLFTLPENVIKRKIEFQPLAEINCNVAIETSRASFLHKMEGTVPDLVVIDRHEESELSLPHTIKYIHDTFNVLRLGKRPKIILYNSGGSGGASGLLSIDKPEDVLRHIN